MNFSRQMKYYYIRLIRLRGAPNELALGMAFGVFAGMLPIVPFQTAFAVTLAILFKGSKITAALGTWVSNPLNWYFQYYYSYKLGALLLGLPKENQVFTSIMTAVRSGEESMVIAGKLVGAGGVIIAAFLLGGLLMGIALAPPAYYIFLQLFNRIRLWRESRKERKNWSVADQ
ncbi:MAG: DUF2062 domain-containing protein [Deltaproteobacteria bacterium]|nr:DUF2062 domain-containing protein [Deltaproteobacteria bacterium]